MLVLKTHTITNNVNFWLNLKVRTALHEFVTDYAIEKNLLRTKDMNTIASERLFVNQIESHWDSREGDLEPTKTKLLYP